MMTDTLAGCQEAVVSMATGGIAMSTGMRVGGKRTTGMRKGIMGITGTILGGRNRQVGGRGRRTDKRIGHTGSGVVEVASIKGRMLATNEAGTELKPTLSASELGMCYSSLSGRVLPANVMAVCRQCSVDALQVPHVANSIVVALFLCVDLNVY